MEFFISNAYWEPLSFEIPPLPDSQRDRWMRIVDTGLDSPEDIAMPGDAQDVEGRTYLVQPRSVVLLSWIPRQGGEE